MKSTSTSKLIALALVAFSALFASALTALSQTLTTSPASLTGFITGNGSASASQSLTINGSGLTGSITVSAPANFEVSSDNATFSYSAWVNKPAGTIQSIYLGAFGNCTTAAGSIWTNGSGSEFPNETAFAAITSNGSVVT